jgi:hypothetical protein
MKARAIAFYLPQYHPVAANDAFWGKGFTEWTNVTKAKPLFRGHHQPFLPSDLGFYDLRVPEVREQQAQLAKEAGIEGFCYWHYWFGNGERVLEKIFRDVVATGSPDFPFCLGWANESWTGKWHGLENEIIFEQKYPGITDYTEHFSCLLPAFHDKRYMRVDGKPIFIIYRPDSLPSCVDFCALWNTLALDNGLPGFHFISNGYQGAEWCSLNGISGWAYNRLSVAIENLMAQQSIGKSNLTQRLQSKLAKKLLADLDPLPPYPPPTIKHATYADYVQKTIHEGLELNEYPVVYPNWDSSPRLEKRAYILLESSADLFNSLLVATVQKLQDRPEQQRLLFIKSWNEWAEGNTLEPSRFHGRSYLDACHQALCDQ